MAEELFQKRSVDSEDLPESLRQYLSMHEDLALDYSEHADYIFADLILLDRSDVQYAIEDRADFSSEVLNRLKEADQFLLDHSEAASEWVRTLVGDTEEPRGHWWWYLDLIADELMDPPDLDSVYSDLIEKAERRNAKAF